MKNIANFVGLFLFAGTVNAQINVPQVQKSLYGIVEATWCGYCGANGIPITNDIITQVGDKAIFFGLHKSSSSQLYSSTAEDIANSIGTTGQPYWTLNGVGLGSYSATLQSSAISTINTVYNPTTTDVNAGFEWYILDDTLYVETLTEFFGPANGDYNVAVYLSEDSIYAYQANYDPAIPNGNLYHNHVLRTSLSQNAFGVQLASGNISSGMTYSNFHKIKIDPSWDLNQIHLSTVIWEGNPGSYTFVNANDSGQENLSASIHSNDVDAIQLTVFPNPSSDVLTVSTAHLKDNSTLRLYDLTGKIVYEIKLVKSIDSSVDVNIDELVSGPYVLTITSDNSGKTLSRQVIVQ